MTRAELVQSIEAQMAENGIEDDAFASDLADRLQAEWGIVEDDEEYTDEEY